MNPVHMGYDFDKLGRGLHGHHNHASSVLQVYINGSKEDYLRLHFPYKSILNLTLRPKLNIS